MQISSIEEYGLRCAVQLIRSGGQTPLSASKISEAEGLSLEYVSKIMFLFRQAGLVKAVRGANGGFLLSRSPDEISLRSIFQAVHPSREKKDQEEFCQNFSGLQNECVHLSDCSVRPVWSMLFLYFDEFLEKLKLSDLIRSDEREMKERIQEIFVNNIRTGAIAKESIFE